MAEEVKGELKSLEALNTPNEEGFVVAYDNGLRVKIKFEDYKRLHRLITGVNPRVIWEMLRDNKGLDQKGLPENFVKWVRQWIGYLTGEIARLTDEAGQIAANCPVYVPHIPVEQSLKFHRAECARYFTREAGDRKYLLPILFAMLDDKDYMPIIWKQIEPAGNDQRFKYSVDATPE